MQLISNTLDRLRAFTICAVLVVTFLGIEGQSHPAHAQDGQTQVDVRMLACEDRPRANRKSALAYSKMGISYCGIGGSYRSAKYNALKECRQRVPRKMRKKAPCEMLSTDQEVLEPHLLDLLRQEVRIPVNLEIYDGDTEQGRKLEATLIYGDAIGPNFRSIQIVGQGEQELCNGRYEITGRKFRFEIRCFNTYRFKDQKSRIDGYLLYKGIYAPVFAATLKRNQSFIKITPPEATVN